MSGAFTRRKSLWRFTRGYSRSTPSWEISYWIRTLAAGAAVGRRMILDWILPGSRSIPEYFAKQEAAWAEYTAQERIF